VKARRKTPDGSSKAYAANAGVGHGDATR